VLAVETFQIALGAGLISAERVSNRADIAYLSYMPFAMSLFRRISSIVAALCHFCVQNKTSYGNRMSRRIFGALTSTMPRCRLRSKTKDLATSLASL
jgi:hypothetical protein